jgi:hypothetical protein
MSIVGYEWQNSQSFILEKPLATNYDQFEVLSQALTRNHLSLYASEPWTYSSIWNEFAELLVDLSPRKIEITRSGPCARNYLTAPQDWLPHDLCLVLNLVKRLRQDSNIVSNATWSEDFQEVDLELDWGSSCRVHLTSRNQVKREACWEFTNNVGSYYRLDFEEKIIVKDSKTVYHMINENPVSNFLESTLNGLNPRLELTSLNLMKSLIC